jgi:hypothetical protein
VSQDATERHQRRNHRWKDIGFEIFRDRCSTFVYVPITMERVGVSEVTIKHPAGKGSKDTTVSSL